MKKFLVLIFIVFNTTAALAADFVNDPFDGGWMPTGTTAFIFYGTQANASKLYQDGDLTARGIDYESQIGIARIAGWRELGSLTYQFSALVPFGKVSMDGAGSVSAIGDPQINLAAQAAKWDTGHITLDLGVVFPLGEYNHNQTLNIGSNRWLFRPTFNVGQNFGKFHLDLMLSGEFYTENTRHGEDKSTLTKNPDYYTELHVSYMLLPESSTFLSVSGLGKWGGEEKVKGVKSNKYNDYAVKFGFGTNITETVNLFLSFKADLKTENGPKGHAATVRLAKFF